MTDNIKNEWSERATKALQRKRTIAGERKLLYIMGGKKFRRSMMRLMMQVSEASAHAEHVIFTELSRVKFPKL